MVTINSENNKNIKPSGDVADTIYNSGSTVTIDVGSGNDLVINGYIDNSYNLGRFKCYNQSR